MAISNGIRAESCLDCERTDSRVRDLTPSQHLAIPAEALRRDLGDVPRQARYNRRAALRNGAVGMAAVYAATRLDWDQIWEAARAEAATTSAARKVVLIYMQGGADGLNMFVPQADAQWASYNGARSNIARTRGVSTSLADVGSTPLPGAAGAYLGLANPLLSGAMNNQLYGMPAGAGGLDTVFGDGSGGAGSNLAIFPAADYDPPNLSHFDSRDYWFAGSVTKPTTTGWLGRWLDAQGSRTNPLQAVSLDSALSKQIRTAGAPVCAIDSLDGVVFDVAGVSGDANRYVQQLGSIAAGRRNAALARSRATYALTTRVSARVQDVAVGTPAGVYPDANASYLSNRLQLAARLLGGGLGTRVITIDWGSFDTHGSEKTAMDPQLAELGACLSAFQADLTARGIADDVITVVFSEFGRRVGSNDSAGTDHGAGGPMMVLGNAVRGGLASEPSDLTTLDDNGDLRVTTDFRHVYRAVLEEWLGADPRRYLPDLPNGTINRLGNDPNVLLKAS